jgi:hypothetical protein
VGQFALVSEVVDILAIFPLSHALVVVSPIVFITDPMRIANEEGPDVLLDAEIDHFARGFVSQVTNPAFRTSALLVLGALHLLPAT